MTLGHVRGLPPASHDWWLDRDTLAVGIIGVVFWFLAVNHRATGAGPVEEGKRVRNKYYVLHITYYALRIPRHIRFDLARPGIDASLQVL
jgi:hypothetical protein